MLSDPSRMRPEHYVDEHEFSKGLASMGAMGSSAPIIFKIVPLLSKNLRRLCFRDILLFWTKLLGKALIYISV